MMRMKKTYKAVARGYFIDYYDPIGFFIIPWKARKFGKSVNSSKREEIRIRESSLHWSKLVKAYLASLHYFGKEETEIEWIIDRKTSVACKNKVINRVEKMMNCLTSVPHFKLHSSIICLDGMRKPCSLRGNRRGEWSSLVELICGIEKGNKGGSSRKDSEKS